MEFIQGGRPDDLQYLADHNIDRNSVSLELARIFARMVHLNGWFHAVSDECVGLLLVAHKDLFIGSPSRCVATFTMT